MTATIARVHAAAVVVAAHGLATSLPRAGGRWSDDEWHLLVAHLREQRLLGLAVAAATDGWFDCTDEQLDELATGHEREMAEVLRLERCYLEVGGRLERAGIEHRLLKGPVVARLDYADPSLRAFADIDLLVGNEDVDRSIGLLAALGFVRIHAQPRAGFDREFGKGASFRSSVDGLEVDLHRTLVLGPFGLRVPNEALFEGGATVRIADVDAPALPAALRFVHACYHAAVTDFPPRLVPLRDVVETLPPETDLEHVLALVYPWSGEAVLARGVMSAWTTLGLPVTGRWPVWAAQYEPTRWERRALSLHQSAGVSYARKAAASVVALPGLRPKLRYTRMLLLPNAEYLGPRDGSYRERALRAVRLWRDR